MFCKNARSLHFMKKAVNKCFCFTRYSGRSQQSCKEKQKADSSRRARTRSAHELIYATGASASGAAWSSKQTLGCTVSKLTNRGERLYIFQAAYLHLLSTYRPFLLIFSKISLRFPRHLWKYAALVTSPNILDRPRFRKLRENQN